jgi:tetratricopeptide (TPR) repeat protein
MTDLDPDRDPPPVTRALQLSRDERRLETGAARERLREYEALPAIERDPLEEARLLSALAALHEASGAYGLALPLHERALVLTKRVLGVKAAETVRCLTSVAFTYTEAGRYRDAEAWARHAVATANDIFPVDHLGRTGPLLAMANAALFADDNMAGERYAREAVDIRTRSLGAEHLSTVHALEYVAGFCHMRGKVLEALEVTRGTYRTLEAALGDAHAEVSLQAIHLAMRLQIASPEVDREEIVDLANRGYAALLEALDDNHPWNAVAAALRGRIYLARSDMDAAQSAFVRALAISETGRGPNHPLTAIHLMDLASALQRKGDLDAAARLIERSVVIKHSVFGRDSRQAADDRFTLAIVHLTQSNHAAAIPLLHETRATRAQVLPASHADITICDELLGIAYYQFGDYASAEPFLRRALDAVEAQHGMHHRDLVPHLNRLGEVYRRLNHFGAARSVYGWAISIQDLAAEPDERALAISLNNMGLACAGLKLYQEAKSAYERALALNERPDVRNREASITNLKNLGSLFIQSGRPVQAVPCFERAMTLTEEEACGVDHVAVADLSNLLGVAHYNAGDFAGAEAPFRRAAELRESALGLMHADTALSYANLANTLTKLGKREEAEAVTLLVQTIREAMALEAAPL